MNIQQIEEYNHNIGSATEFQNAYALSRMEAKREEANPKAIAYLRSKGYYIAISSWTTYCPFTDAILFGNTRIINSSKDYQTALGFLGGEESEEGYLIHPNDL